jgi:hypothetical protein
MTRCRAALLLLTTFAFLPRAGLAQPAKGQTPTPHANEECLACHGDPAAVRPDGRSIGVSTDRFGASIHGQAGIACVACHADLATADFPHPEKVAPVACATCHADQGAKYDVSVHAEARRATPGSVAAACQDCHGSHDVRPSSDPESRTYHLNLPRTCGACHGNAEIIRRGAIAVGDVYHAFQDSIHGRALTEGGLMVAPNCGDCHGAHDILREKSPGSRVHRTNVPATCGKCHEGIVHRYEVGIHGTELKKGNPLAPACDDCHSAHEVQRTDVGSFQLQVMRECGTCHEESIKTYRDTFHGQVTSLGFVRVATCADCHAAHDIFPPSDARSKVARAHVVKTCAQCHEGATERFARYDPHADKHDRARNPLLYYAARFMQLLLVGVFSFFGIHTTLWLSRALVERRRRPAGRQDATSAIAPTESDDGEQAGDRD